MELCKDIFLVHSIIEPHRNPLLQKGSWAHSWLTGPGLYM